VVADKKPLSPNHGRWLIEARKRNQDLLLFLYKASVHFETRETGRERRELFLYLVGAAFSLWRAAFLCDTEERTWNPTIGHAKELLATVLTDNAVSYTTERRTVDWMGGYYLNNAMLRLHEARELLHDLDSNTQDNPPLKDLDRLKEAGDVEGRPSRDLWDISSNALGAMSEWLERGLGNGKGQSAM